jgi:hypothetical protein
MTKYPGLMIYQISNDGISRGSPPNKTGLDAWVAAYKPAGVSGIDPLRRSSKIYYTGGSVGIPYNIIVDAKTRKILKKKVPLSSLEPVLSQYLP